MPRPAVPLAAVLVAAAFVVPARATDTVVSAAGNTFVPGDITMTAGSRLTFTNADAAPHNVVADASDRRGPIFHSDVATTGKSVTVDGVERLKPSTYTFACSLHPQMRGTLTVTAPGPVATAAPVLPVSTGGSVATPTSIAVRNGTLYAASYATGTVSALPILPGGALGPATPYASGFDSPLGIAFAPDGTLYVADSHDVNGRRVGRVWSVKGGTNRTVIDGLPNGRHNTNGLAVANNRLYVANGNATDDGVNGGPKELPLNGTVLSYALPVTTRSKPAVEARGLRNVYDLAFRPGAKNDLWFATNGPDAQDPYGEDLLHRVDVSGPTKDYGFPGCVYDANLKAKKGCHGARPERALGLHVSADGVAFGTGGVWGSDLYVAEYGSNAPPPAGHKVVRIPIVNGRAGAPQDVVVGPSPIDLAFGPDGLYVADFDTGAILLLRAVG